MSPTHARRLVLALCTAAASVAIVACKERPAPSAAPATSAPAPAPAAPRTTASGLTITDLTPGTGEPCPEHATITMNFTARLAGGDIYDSSDLRKRSWTIELANPNVIAGLREGIPGMRTGATRRLEIPWSLAYGEHGREPIPPKTDLVWEIQLLEWEPGAPAPTVAD